MEQKFRKLILLLLVALLASALPAAGQSACEHKDFEAYAMDVFRDKLRDQPSGTSFSWIDVISRVVAQIDSLDLDSGETTTDLTWNVEDRWIFKTSLVNEPDLFMPLKEAIGDDKDLLESLSGQVAQGDDVQVSLDYNFQNKKPKQSGEAAKLGVWAVLETTARQVQQKVEQQSQQSGSMAAAIYSTLSSADCSQREQFYAGMAPAMIMFLEDEKPRTLTANGFYRSRGDLVGPDEIGVSFKYTYGFNDPQGDRGDATRTSLIQNAMMVSAQNLAQSEPTFAASLTSALQAQGQTLSAQQASLAASDLAAEEAKRTGITDRRLAVEGKWNRKDDYDYMFPEGDPLTLPEDESISVMLAYSFRFRGDEAAADADLPLFELSASYEDVDGDSARQSRLIAKAIVSRKLSFMGENSELTAGLVYANKPEYLAEQDLDRELSANLGLTFKVGSRPAKK